MYTATMSLKKSIALASFLSYSAFAIEPTIVLDPGHGGKVDSGTTVAKIHEDEINYDIAVRVHEILSKNKFKSHITVIDLSSTTPQQRLKNDSDESLNYATGPLPMDKRYIDKRCELINSFGEQSILVSIHNNYLSKSYRGACIYHPRHPESIRLATSIAKAMKKNGLKLYTFRGKSLPSILANPNYVVLQTTLEAKVLVECTNLANSADRKIILNSKMRQKYAQAIAEGVQEYRTQRINAY